MPVMGQAYVAVIFNEWPMHFDTMETPLLFLSIVKMNTVIYRGEVSWQQAKIENDTSRHPGQCIRHKIS